MPTYLITGATGQVGSGLIHHLLSQSSSSSSSSASPPPTIHALVRDPSSPASLLLSSQGIKLFPGTFSSPSSLALAATGCDGLFMCIPTPFGPSLTEELENGLNIITAARAAGIKHVIYTSVYGLTSPEERGLTRDSFFGAYYANKMAIEEAVRTAGFERWTILRPAGFVTNFLLPGSAFMAPELASRGVLQTALDRELVVPWVVPSDVGRFAARAFEEGERWSGKTVEIACEKWTMEEYAGILGRVAGKKVQVEYWSREEVEKMEGKNLIAESQVRQNEFPGTLDLEVVRGWGVPMMTVEEFFMENRERVVESVGGE